MVARATLQLLTGLHSYDSCCHESDRSSAAQILSAVMEESTLRNTNAYYRDCQVSDRDWEHERMIRLGSNALGSSTLTSVRIHVHKAKTSKDLVCPSVCPRGRTNSKGYPRHHELIAAAQPGRPTLDSTARIACEQMGLSK